MAQVAETNATLPSHEDDGHETGTQGMLCGVEQLGGKSGEQASFGSGRIQGRPALAEAESRRSMDDVVRSAHAGGPRSQTQGPDRTSLAARRVGLVRRRMEGAQQTPEAAATGDRKDSWATAAQVYEQGHDPMARALARRQEATTIDRQSGVQVEKPGCGSCMGVLVQAACEAGQTEALEHEGPHAVDRQSDGHCMAVLV
jgi:hypothetical protein